MGGFDGHLEPAAHVAKGRGTLSSIYYWSYVVIVVVLFLNIAVAILVDSYVTVKEQDQGRSHEETLIAHRQLRLLVADIEMLHPSNPCLRLPCTACKRKWQQRRGAKLYRTRTQSKVVMVGSPPTANATSNAIGAGVTDTSTEASETPPRTKKLPTSNIQVVDSTSHWTPVAGKSRSRALSYWIEPWARPSNMGIEALASTLERLADLNAPGVKEGGTEIMCPTITTAIIHSACSSSSLIATDFLPGSTNYQHPRQRQHANTGTVGDRAARSSTASTADTFSRMSSTTEEATHGEREVYLDSYAVALKLAKAGAPSHWARRIATIFGTRYRTQLRESLPRQEPTGMQAQTTKGMTLIEVVSQAAAELGIDRWTERGEQASSLSLAATLQRCMVEVGLSQVAANGELMAEAEISRMKGGKSGTTLRQRAAAVAAELEIATGWD